VRHVFPRKQTSAYISELCQTHHRPFLTPSRTMSRIRLSILTIGFVSFLHLAGLYLFTRGFLLTRLSLADVSTCADTTAPCTLPPRHKRAIVLIIDALRFDFISPDPPTPNSVYHHHVLTLPAELSASQPGHSLIFDAYADPPTTTLQRIKALVTGSLPTFVDMGSNFGGSSIEEDSLVKQLLYHGKKVSVTFPVLQELL
jgi:phosphatidylinositol glycan class O